MRFTFEVQVYQYTVLPFGRSLAPYTFTKCKDTALSPLRQQADLSRRLAYYVSVKKSRNHF